MQLPSNQWTIVEQPDGSNGMQPPQNYTNVFRLTATNGNFGNPGDRIVALYVWNGQLCFYRSGIPNECQMLNNFDIEKWYHVVIQQLKVNDKYWYKVIINDELKKCEELNEVRKWSDVQLYTSDPFYPPFNVQIGNICNFIIEENHGKWLNGMELTRKKRPYLTSIVGILVNPKRATREAPQPSPLG